MSDLTQKNQPSDSRDRSPEPGGLPDLQLDKRLYWSVVVFLVLLSGLLVSNQLRMYKIYGAAIGHTAASTAPDHALILSYTRALDFATVKTCAVLAGLMLTGIGALYVLRIAPAAFSLSYSSNVGGAASLVTSSPGLVLAVLGTVAALVALNARSLISYEGFRSTDEPPSATAPAANNGRTPELPTVHFELGSNEISDEAKRQLAAACNALYTLHHSAQWVDVEGFPDPGDGGGSNELALVVADRRAEAVRNFLVDTGCVPSHWLRIISYGERPIHDAQVLTGVVRLTTDNGNG